MQYRRVSHGTCKLHYTEHSKSQSVNPLARKRITFPQQNILGFESWENEIFLDQKHFLEERDEHSKLPYMKNIGKILLDQAKECPSRPAYCNHIVAKQMPLGTNHTRVRLLVHLRECCLLWTAAALQGFRLFRSIGHQRILDTRCQWLTLGPCPCVS